MSGVVRQRGLGWKRNAEKAPMGYEFLGPRSSEDYVSNTEQDKRQDINSSQHWGNVTNSIQVLT